MFITRFFSTVLVCLLPVPIFAQDAYLKDPAPEQDDVFGMGLATSGDTLVIGTPTGGPGDDGSAVVYVSNGATWILQDEILPTSGTPGSFGQSVALDGDTLVVGSPNEGDLGTPTPFSGAAYVYVRSGSSWTEQDYLKAPVPVLVGQLGLSVGVSGDTLVVGAPGEAGAAGNAHVFVRSGSSWTHQATLTAGPDADPGDFFGFSVGISGETIVVGAYAEAGSGAAYVFTRSGSSWTQQDCLKAANADPSDQFGWSSAISGETIVVGAPREQSTATGVNGNAANNGFPGSGAAYVFERSGSTWTQQAYVKASNTGFADQFGFAVALVDDVLLVGAPTEESAATGVNGDEGDNSVAQAGAAYLFDRVAGNWTQRSYLKASDPGEQDTFGLEVAVSSANALVGAPLEDSNATGVGGDPTNNSLEDSGAAYLYESGPVASLSFRNGGSNPASYTATPPVLGSTMSATIDLGATSGHSMALLIGFSTPLNVTLGSGQTLLVNPADPSGEQLALGVVSGPVANYQLPVPNDPVFLGFPISTQAIHFGGVFPFALSNAQDFVLGF